MEWEREMERNGKWNGNGKAKWNGNGRERNGNSRERNGNGAGKKELQYENFNLLKI